MFARFTCSLDNKLKLFLTRVGSGQMKNRLNSLPTLSTYYESHFRVREEEILVGRNTKLVVRCYCVL